MLNPKPRIAVAVSGRGRTLSNLLSREFPFSVGAVICSNPNAAALTVATDAGLPLYLRDFRSVDPLNLSNWLVDLGISWIALGGFLKPFPSLPAFENRVINIHPSLLPVHGGHGMYGLRVHEAVVKAGETHSGATVHFVNERYDEGAIIAQSRIDVSGAKTPQQLAEAIFQLECAFYPEVIARLISHQLPLDGGRIWHFAKG